MRDTRERQNAKQGNTAAMGPSPPGSRNVWYMGECSTHGTAPFNTYIDGCELCASARIKEQEA